MSDQEAPKPGERWRNRLSGTEVTIFKPSKMLCPNWPDAGCVHIDYGYSVNGKPPNEGWDLLDHFLSAWERVS